MKFEGLSAIFVNCTLKPSPTLSHTQGLMDRSIAIMKREGVKVESFRMVDYSIAPGVYPDMKKYGFASDDWPVLYPKILSADILIVGTPIWLGEKSSEATRLIERLYALSGMTNEKGQYIFYGKTGGCVITGNEDGIKHCSMSILYSLQHVGYTIPPQADCGWIGEAGPGPSYLDPEAKAYENQFTNRNMTFMTYNLMHTAKMLRANNGIDSYGNSRKDWDEGLRWNFENPEYR